MNNKETAQELGVTPEQLQAIAIKLLMEPPTERQRILDMVDEDQRDILAKHVHDVELARANRNYDKPMVTK